MFTTGQACFLFSLSKIQSIVLKARPFRPSPPVSFSSPEVTVLMSVVVCLQSTFYILHMYVSVRESYLVLFGVCLYNLHKNRHLPIFILYVFERSRWRHTNLVYFFFSAVKCCTVRPHRILFIHFPIDASGRIWAGNRWSSKQKGTK